jgi:lysophospholipase L1-like esterase
LASNVATQLFEYDTFFFGPDAPFAEPDEGARLMSRYHGAQRASLRIAAHVVVVLALVGVVTLLAIRAFERLQPNESSQSNGSTQHNSVVSPQPHEKLFDQNPSLLVVTDSLGVVTDAVEGKLYPDLLGEKLGWNVVADAVPARGYVTTDLNLIGIDRIIPPAIENLQYDAEHYKADYIIVDVGRNDLGKDPAIVEPAVNEYLTRLRSYYQRATIVVIVPCPVSSSRNPLTMGTWPVVAPAIRAVAEKIGAHILDPLTDGWYRDIDLSPLQISDHVHLNSAGAEFYAQKIIDGMRPLGIN